VARIGVVLGVQQDVGVNDHLLDTDGGWSSRSSTSLTFDTSNRARPVDVR
jgi:hypothetical protein